MKSESAGAAPITRSRFVTNVAWTFIALAGLSTFIGLAQNVLILSTPAEEVAAVTRAAAAGDRPAPMRFITDVRVIFPLFLLLALSTLVAAIGVLRRKNWARLLFAGLLVLGLVWYAVGLTAGMMSISAKMQVPADAPQEIQARMEAMRTFLKVSLAIIAAGITAVLGWIIVRLLSPSVRGEFS